MKRRIIFALTVAGFTAMASQIVLMRELLVVFYGNELSLGIILASWLFWVGLGSLGIARPTVGRIKNKIGAFTLCEVGLSFFLPLSVVGARFIPAFFRFSPGEIIGFMPMTIGAFILLAPVSLLNGFLFTMGCEIYGIDKKEAAGIGYVYAFEAIGAAAGGLLTSLLLIRLLAPLYIMALAGLLNLAAAFLLLGERKIQLFCTGLLIAVFIFIISTGKVDMLKHYSLNKKWQTYELLASENSIYGNVAVTKKEDIYSVFTNGLYAFSVPDKLTSEMNAHFPLLEHPNPKDILLVGGGSSGLLEEVLKHPIQSVHYVELDPMVINLTKKFLPPNEAFSDARVKVITDMDGRLFIKMTNQKYDVIILSIPEPYTAQLNRLYTQEFYAEARGALRNGGILSFTLSSNPNYMSPEQVKLFLSLKDTLEEVFEDVKITPGGANHFLASGRKGVLTLEWPVLVERLKARDIKSLYMREYYLFSELSRERIDSFERNLTQPEMAKEWAAGRLNRDFRPISYYYDMVLWSSYFKYGFRRFFAAVTPKRIYAGVLFLYLLLFLPLRLKVIKKKIPSWGVLTCIGTTGFAEMAFQIVTLLSFQVMYGYVYYKLGLILTSYMIGLIFGSLLITRSLDKIKNAYNLFMKTQGVIFIYPLILAVLFWTFSALKGRFSFWLGSNIVFPFLPVIPGIIGGFQFPLANRLYLNSRRAGPGSAAGLTYGIDLIGACLGAVFVAVFLIPIVGIYISCLLVAGLNLAGLAVLSGYKGAAEKV